MLIRCVLIISLISTGVSCVSKNNNETKTPIVESESKEFGGLRRFEIKVGERQREYLVYTPKSMEGDTADRPLVIFSHGGGGTAEAAANEVGESLFALAEKDKFYVAFPHAINKIWDFGTGPISEKLKERVDDRSYFGAMMDDISSRVALDKSRIFASGLSRGGQASYFLACNFPDRIRAIAPAIMPLPVHLRESCSKSPSVGVLVMNGTEDPLVPYDGGFVTVLGQQRDEVLSTDDTIAFWRERNGCSDKSKPFENIDSVDDGMHVEKTEWRECTGDPVVLYKVVGGGHTWPSGNQYLPKLVIGSVNKDINGADVIWGFFKAFK